MKKTYLLKCLSAVVFFVFCAGTVLAQNNPGDVWIVTPQPVLAGQPFFIEVHVNSGTSKLAAYGIDITYPSQIMRVNTSMGNEGKEAVRPYGYVTATNAVTTGTIVCTGFDINGTGPAGDMHILNIHFIATADGIGNIGLIVDSLTDNTYAKIGTPRGIGNTLTIVSSLLPGDVNMSGQADIVDALVVAQYSATVKKTIRLNPAVADVNSNGTVDIVDALIIAQYSAGIVPQLPL